MTRRRTASLGSLGCTATVTDANTGRKRRCLLPRVSKDCDWCQVHLRQTAGKKTCGSSCPELCEHVMRRPENQVQSNQAPRNNQQFQQQPPNPVHPNAYPQPYPYGFPHPLSHMFHAGPPPYCGGIGVQCPQPCSQPCPQPCRQPCLNQPNPPVSQPVSTAVPAGAPSGTASSGADSKRTGPAPASPLVVQPQMNEAAIGGAIDRAVQGVVARAVNAESAALLAAQEAKTLRFEANASGRESNRVASEAKLLAQEARLAANAAQRVADDAKTTAQEAAQLSRRVQTASDQLDRKVSTQRENEEKLRVITGVEMNDLGRRVKETADDLRTFQISYQRDQARLLGAEEAKRVQAEVTRAELQDIATRMLREFTRIQNEFTRIRNLGSAETADYKRLQANYDRQAEQLSRFQQAVEALEINEAALGELRQLEATFETAENKMPPPMPARSPPPLPAPRSSRPHYRPSLPASARSSRTPALSSRPSYGLPAVEGRQNIVYRAEDASFSDSDSSSGDDNTEEDSD